MNTEISLLKGTVARLREKQGEIPEPFRKFLPHDIEFLIEDLELLCEMNDTKHSTRELIGICGNILCVSKPIAGFLRDNNFPEISPIFEQIHELVTEVWKDLWNKTEKDNKVV